jgi:hypothetical protein
MLTRNEQLASKREVVMTEPNRTGEESLLPQVPIRAAAELAVGKSEVEVQV